MAGRAEQDWFLVTGPEAPFSKAGLGRGGTNASCGGGRGEQTNGQAEARGQENGKTRSPRTVHCRRLAGGMVPGQEIKVRLGLGGLSSDSVL